MQPYFTNIDINIFVIFKDIKGNGVKFKRERKKGRKKERIIQTGDRAPPHTGDSDW